MLTNAWTMHSSPGAGATSEAQGASFSASFHWLLRVFMGFRVSRLSGASVEELERIGEEDRALNRLPQRAVHLRAERLLEKS